ncbi:MAG: hypothetical protein P4L85_22655 [Paludisphaera borealis]|uniref:hypothetical protein n=1 Tax=Paludisphaera borealis TaxID=1387353 RepID=UPI0028403BDC|nr:hypothetical protein [Paludisphaera borealis]MDR3622169.1 hypothetical protein [Paludisphaera borealis]
MSRDRKRFAAALGLFFVWIALLVGLAVKSGYRPMDRAGMVPVATDEPQAAPE